MDSGDRAVEARKQFKTFVNILSTMKNEDSEKLLVLRKKYLNKCPADTSMNVSGQSAGNLSGMEATGVAPVANVVVVDSNRSAPSTPAKMFASAFEATATSSPYLTPPPYKPPPPAPQQQQQQLHLATPPAPVTTGIVSSNTQEQYRECVDEFKWALNAFSGAKTGDDSAANAGPAIQVPGVLAGPAHGSGGAVVVGVELKQRVVEASDETVDNRDKENAVPDVQATGSKPATLEKQISVKEATKKFNQIASEEEVKLVTSPPAKKPMHMQQQQQQPEKVCTRYRGVFAFRWPCGRAGVDVKVDEPHRCTRKYFNYCHRARICACV